MTGQALFVYQYMMTGKKISSLAAFEYGITRLSDVIYRLKRENVPIRSETATITTRYGNKAHYSLYWIPEDYIKEAAANGK